MPGQSKLRQLTEQEITYLLLLIESRSIEEGDCILFQRTDKHGSPRIGLRAQSTGKQMTLYVRNMLMQIYTGQRVPRGWLAANRCGDPDCIKREHLALMTRGEIQARTIARTKYNKTTTYRAKLSAGNVSKRKLTDEQVEMIRCSDKPLRELARELNVGAVTVWKARKGLTYMNYHHQNPFTGLMR